MGRGKLFKLHLLFMRPTLTHCAFLAMTGLTAFLVILGTSFGPLSQSNVQLKISRNSETGSRSTRYGKNSEFSKEKITPNSSVTKLDLNMNISSRRNHTMHGSQTFADGQEELQLVCMFPKVDPFEPSIVELLDIGKQPLHYRDAEYQQITYVSGKFLKVNLTKVRNSLSKEGAIHCRFRGFTRESFNDNGIVTTSWSKKFSNKILLKEKAELLQVVCNNKSQVVSKMYHALIPLNRQISDLYDLNIAKRMKDMAPKETMNILMIGHDSVSRNQFLRGMEKTYDYLMKEFSSFDLSMYNQQGRNTFPNFLPLLTGRTAKEYASWWGQISSHTDAFDFIWRDYEKAGYRTLYTEDCPEIGAFNYMKKGFLLSPTHYYGRTISLALAKDKSVFNTGRNCMGDLQEQVFHLNYVERLFDTFPTKPVFAFAFFTGLTHDDMTKNRMADELLVNFYKSLQSKGHLNNTLVISFSDHGPRWGPIRATFQGLVESRAPYAVLSFPKWFTKKYPDIARNLHLNTNRLSSPVDVHATLWDLLYFKSREATPQFPKRHGISLFSEIPRNRTCQDVPIDPEFCLCDMRNMEKMDLDFNSQLAQNLTEKVIAALRAKTDRRLCEELDVKRLFQIVKIPLPLTDEMLYKVRLETVPGSAIYEATVRSNTKGVNVETEIDRLNLYQGESECVGDARQMPYCYCKNLFITDSENTT